MDFETVSAKNPLISQLRRLSGRRSARVEQGRFLVEGPKLIATALDAGVALDLVLRDGEVALDGAGERLVERAAASGARLVSLPAGLMARVADTVTPQPLAAVATRRTIELDDVLDEVIAAGRDALPILVLAGIADPGNAGTLLRSAEAAGAGAVVFCAGSVDPFHPKTVRASAGSIFLVPVVDGPSAQVVLAALGERGVRRVATVARGGIPMDEADLRGAVALVLGSEAHGLPEGVDPFIDQTVTIAMRGRSESLNVAMAGTLAVFEAARQRRLPAN